MFNVLWFIGKTLFIVLAVFGLTKLLNRKSILPKGKILEGEIVEENKEKEVKLKKEVSNENY